MECYSCAAVCSAPRSPSQSNERGELVVRIAAMRSNGKSETERRSDPSAITNALDAIRDKLGITFGELAQLLDTTPETVSRWRARQADPDPFRFKMLAAVAWLAEDLSELYEPANAKLWLYTPQRRLEGFTPARRIEQNRIAEVLVVVEQLLDGAIV